MGKTENLLTGLLVGIAVGMIGTAIYLLISFSQEPSYKDGQIDAMTGKIKYELVTQPDSTRTWEKIK